MNEISDREKHRLLRWQRRMIASFVATWVWIALVLGVELALDLPVWVTRAGMLGALVLVVVAGVVQFSAVCPRCGYRLGFQSRLLVPDRCKRCDAALRTPRDPA